MASHHVDTRRCHFLLLARYVHNVAKRTRGVYKISVILRTDPPTNDQPMFLEEPSWKNSTLNCHISITVLGRRMVVMRCEKGTKYFMLKIMFN